MPQNGAVIHLESRAKVVATKIADHLCVGGLSIFISIAMGVKRAGVQVKLVAPPASRKFRKMLHRVTLAGEKFAEIVTQFLTNVKNWTVTSGCTQAGPKPKQMTTRWGLKMGLGREGAGSMAVGYPSHGGLMEASGAKPASTQMSFDG